MSRHRASYDKNVIKGMLSQPHNVERLVQELYPEATRAENRRDFLVADARGGQGRSCVIHTAGDLAGRFHDFNPAGSAESGDLIEATSLVRGCSFPEALRFIGDLLGAPDLRVVTGGQASPPTLPARKRRLAPEELGVLNPETEQKNRRALEQSPEARAYLAGRGLRPETLDHFRIGVLRAWENKDRPGEMMGPVVASPIISREGKPLARTHVPGWTQGFTDPKTGKTSKGGVRGGPFSTWDGRAGDKEILFVCEGMKDQRRLWQEIQGTSLAVRRAILTSTHGSGLPSEWEDPDFWRPWRKVILGHDNDAAGETMAQKIRGLARRDFIRLEAPRELGKDWTDFFKAGRTIVDLEKLIETARVYGLPGPCRDAPKPLRELADGDYEDGRININGAFVGGRMYYPFKVRNVDTELQPTREDDQVVIREVKVSRYATRIVRSDGVILGHREDPAPRAVRREDRVVTLDDGTEIASVPEPDLFCTWRLSSIQWFCEDRKAGRTPHRPLGRLLADVEAYLKTTTWLPNPNDFTILAVYVALSYVYNAFEAIPMILITGEKGSGKSTTASAVAGLSCNGHVMGAGSEAALIRFADQGRCLLVLDDLERVGRASRNENGLGDINEVLKVSYDKATAVKAITEDGRVRKLEFFGPKVITNITGIDPVNATRIFTIVCRPMPAAVAASGQIRGIDRAAAEPLRQELHAWGMAQIADVHRTYGELFLARSDRSAQIAAPLQAIASVSGDASFQGRLSEALARQARFKTDALTPEDVLREAVDEVVARGARRWTSLPQIMNELALIPEARMTDPAHLVPDDFAALQDRQRLGRMLGSIGARARNEGKVNLCGQKTRTYEIDPDYVEAALARLRKAGRQVDPEFTAVNELRLGVALCDTVDCGSCPYSHVCEAATGLQKGKVPPAARTSPFGPRRGGHL